MAISPTNANDVFVREVDDAVRDDYIRNFWSRFGKAVLGLIVVGLIGYGGYLFYNHSQSQDAGETAELYVKAMNEAQIGNPAAAKTLALVKAEGDDAYRAVALLTEANIAAGKNDDKQAITLFGQVAADTKAPQPYRDIALLKQTVLQFDTLKPDEVIARFKGLAVESNPMFPSAAELTALALMKQGKDAEAGALYGKIAAFEGAPEALKSRAQQMAGMLGVDAIKPPADKAAAGDAAAPTDTPPQDSSVKATGGETK